MTAENVAKTASPELGGDAVGRGRQLVAIFNAVETDRRGVVQALRQADMGAEIDEFVAAVTGDGRPSVGGEDGLLALQLAEAAQTSVAGGRMVAL